MEQSPFPVGFMRLVGAAEVLAAFGLVLLGLTGVLTWLTPLAATGLAPIMAGAVVLHLASREFPQALVTVILLALVVFVAYARFFVIPL
ncbi:MAG: hypothetical protein AVDCRST_MAG02-2515 [uncultured Rubrobacteraceae bacterium]|uniref:DoxX family protein n=1 Tax=uncultured Rubrobacteraceae bacterium TaxID=349277 RepID=A0A6J4R2B5_9ACTN|nr:MAG: hypothetical protein AVDCRST_MAG02-2515 [uncultured Rubrobacteraceae bacterium]